MSNGFVLTRCLWIPPAAAGERKRKRCYSRFGFVVVLFIVAFYLRKEMGGKKRQMGGGG
jgi:hypothetical protein